MSQVNVNRQRVLQAIIELRESCSTQEIANTLSTPERLIPERSVRAAVAWLILSGYLVRQESSIVRHDARGIPYRVWLYTWTGKSDPITGKKADAVRRNKEERQVQSWGATNEAGIMLQNIFGQMRGAS